MRENVKFVIENGEEEEAKHTYLICTTFATLFRIEWCGYFPLLISLYVSWNELLFPALYIYLRDTNVIKKRIQKSVLV